MASSGFPRFSDGDVEIHFSEDDNDKYVLHSWQLSLHSPWFKASLSDRWKTAGSDTTKSVNGKNHWVYELRFDKDSDLGTLVQKSSPSPTDTELAPCSKTLLLEETDEARRGLQAERADVIDAHQNILRILYHIRPTFSQWGLTHPIESTVTQFAKVAEIYGCENIARLQIEHYLRQCQDDIEGRCARDPVSMLEFSLTVKSEWIFKEAATHLLGRSNRFFAAAEDDLAALGIWDVPDNHRTQFVKRLHECESEMFRIQQSHHTSWLGHAALNFFRQWLTEHLEAEKGSGLGPGYANLYHTIHKGTFSYEVPAQKQQIRKYMTRVYENFTEENMRDLELELNKIFNKAAAVVEPIVQQHTHRKNTSKDNYRALTFQEIDLDELPSELDFDDDT